MNKQILTTALFCGVLTGCGSTGSQQSTANAESNNTAPQPAQATQSATVAKSNPSAFKIAYHSPYKDEQIIQSNIIDECGTLGSELSNWTEYYGEEKGISIERQREFDANSEGKNLKIEITNAHSSGAAGFGHAKSVTIKATLFKDGQEIDSYRASRSSNGGFFGGFKGSCSVLNRCVKTLGNDISKWLRKHQR